MFYGENLNFNNNSMRRGFMKKKVKKDVYQIITDQIINLLEQGVIPWHKPWNAENGAPCNLSSGKAYRGINTFLLSCMGGSKYWLTFKQAKDMKGTVKKGSKGAPVVFWNWREREIKDEKTGEVEIKTNPIIRYYTVFNLDQIEGVETPKEEETEKLEFTPIEAAEKIINGMPNSPEIRYGGNRAFYSPITDLVGMPEKVDFEGAEEFYNTFFHELTHSTGHLDRLKIKEVENLNPFGSASYSREELVAEMGAAFLCGHSGIERKTITNSASYIGSWLKKLRNDKKFVVTAAAQAQKAADFILDKKKEN